MEQLLYTSYKQNYLVPEFCIKIPFYNLSTNHIYSTLYQNLIPITDLENQLNSISEDYGLSLGILYPPTHPTLVIFKRKGF